MFQGMDRIRLLLRPAPILCLLAWSGAAERETTFKEAYELFAAVRKRWNPDGTAKE